MTPSPVPVSSKTPVVVATPSSSATAKSSPPVVYSVYTPPVAPSSSKAAVSSAPANTPAGPSKEAYSVPASSSKAVSTPQPSSASYSHGSGSYASTGRIVTKGDKWAITYTPYTSSGDCKSQSEVQSDISKIAAMGFTTIRSYSTDCGVFENVVPACQAHGLKVIYGIFIEGGGSSGKGTFSSYANDQLKEIISRAPKDSVALLIVGNEFLFNGYGTAQDLGSYIDYCRKELISAGFPSEIAVTTTEPVNIWESLGKDLCSHIDVFGVQVHPFFTSSVSASDAGKFAKSQLAQAAAVCPEVAKRGKYITETGWPSAGESNGQAVPGVSEQKTAIKSILQEVGSEACIFSFQDDKWKAPGSFDVEQNFGCSEALN